MVVLHNTSRSIVAHGNVTPSEHHQKEEEKAQKKYQQAYTTTRSFIFYNTTATIPLLIIAAILLFTNIRGTPLFVITILGAITSFVGFSRLIQELIRDIIGDPDNRLPVWSVFYLIIYLLSFFTYVFFGIHLKYPGKYYEGISLASAKEAFIDSVYLSLCDYISVAPEGITSTRQITRFLNVIHGMLSMFVNVVIITKFVDSF
jgi:hypothetical protein